MPGWSIDLIVGCHLNYVGNKSTMGNSHRLLYKDFINKKVSTREQRLNDLRFPGCTRRPTKKSNFGSTLPLIKGPFIEHSWFFATDADKLWYIVNYRRGIRCGGLIEDNNTVQRKPYKACGGKYGVNHEGVYDDKRNFRCGKLIRNFIRF